MTAPMVSSPPRTMRIFTVAILAVLSVQDWTGDFVNVFTSWPNAAVEQSPTGAFLAVFGIGAALIYHTFEGLGLFVLAVLVLALALRTRTRSVKIVAILGLLMVVSAGMGGILFVLSGFQANGSSMQMSGSFIGAYALYFLVLYFSK